MSLYHIMKNFLRDEMLTLKDRRDILKKMKITYPYKKRPSSHNTYQTYTETRVCCEHNKNCKLFRFKKTGNFKN